MKERFILIIAIVTIVITVIVPFRALGMDMSKITSKGSGNVSQTSGWLRYLIAPGIVGILVLVGQLFINPMIARRVKIQESIAEKRYEVCDKAVNILQRRLASVQLKGPNVPSHYKPAEKSPGQLEINETYTLLSLYCTDASIADKFREVVKTEGISQQDIGNFILALRSEMGVKGQALDPKDFRYLYGWQKEKISNEETINRND